MLRKDTLSDLRKAARDIFDHALRAVDPVEAVKRHIHLDGGVLRVKDRNYNLREFENIYVVGTGKAGASMAYAAEEILGDRIKEGIVNVKYGHIRQLKKIKLNEAGHPVPNRAGMRGAEEIVRLLNQAGADDLVICLISGGGSALLPLPVSGMTLEEKGALTRLLLECGADINEINALRKHISQIKGGQLARAASPSTLITLILSDVIGDPMDTIASGPTVPDKTTFKDVEAILNKYDLMSRVPQSVRRHIKRGLSGEVPDTPKQGDKVFDKTYNLIIGSNILAVMAARGRAEELGFRTLVLSSFVEGETKDVARVHAAIAKEVLSSGNPLPPPCCIISGGETTVTIRGSGKGGRNQEFALAAAMDIGHLSNVVILSGGTDGTDGPTDAAGALCDNLTLQRAVQTGLSPMEHLKNNDSYNFFARLGDLLMTGPTNTNVMDLHLVLVGGPS